MSKKLPKLQNKFFGVKKTSSNDEVPSNVVVADRESSLNAYTRNLSYQVIKKTNIYSGKKKIKLAFIKCTDIISITPEVLEVPYGSRITGFNKDILTVVDPNGVTYTAEATCSASYHVSSWGNYPEGELLSNVDLQLQVQQNLINLTFTCESGTLNTTGLTVPESSSYVVNGNTLTITDIYNQVHNIVFTPNVTDTYYTYAETGTWNTNSTSGYFFIDRAIHVSLAKEEKVYSCDLSWGQNNPEVNPEEISGWDNGGNVYGVSLLADHTYVLHREDSAGTSVSYLGLVNDDGSHTIIEPYTVNTDVIYVGVSGFYFGDVVNDEEPAVKYCEDLTEKTTTSINYFFKPGDYIRDNGNQTIKINIHRKQSCCWHTLRGGSWERTRITNSSGKSVTGPSSKTSDDFTWNLDGIVANRPVYMYIGFGSTVSTTTTGHATDSKPWDWIDDGGCSWSITGESTGQIHTHYNAGTRATLLYTWWRWVFQRLY